MSAEDSARAAEAAAESAAGHAAHAATDAEIAGLQADVARLEAEEATDDQVTADLAKRFNASQGQLLWILSGVFLVGAVAGHILDKAFG